MRLDDLDVMPASVFWAALNAHWEEKATDRRHLGELVRGATMYLFNVQVTAKDRKKDPRKFWPMPWDEADNGKAVERLQAMTREERMAEAQKLIDRLDKHNGEKSQS